MSGLRWFLCFCLFVGCGGQPEIDSSPEEIEKRRQAHGKRAQGELEQNELDRAKYNQDQED